MRSPAGEAPARGSPPAVQRRRGGAERRQARPATPSAPRPPALPPPGAVAARRPAGAGRGGRGADRDPGWAPVAAAEPAKRARSLALLLLSCSRTQGCLRAVVPVSSAVSAGRPAMLLLVDGARTLEAPGRCPTGYPAELQMPTAPRPASAGQWAEALGGVRRLAQVAVGSGEADSCHDPPAPMPRIPPPADAGGRRPGDAGLGRQIRVTGDLQGPLSGTRSLPPVG